MARENVEQGLMPSILDRLIDPESTGTAWRHGYGVEQMVEAVQRDLEDLLNTRQVVIDVPESYREVNGSIVTYGLPDLASFNAITPEQREDIGRALEAIVSRFEPRLKDVRATMIGSGDGLERRVRFKVEARLCVDPAPEVAFDTILELSTGHYSVKQANE
jgi:type VI secretion system protein ImpF